jgi:hypothetical protein
MSLTAHSGGQAMSYQNRVQEIESAGDIIDVMLVIALAASEIAVDVFGMFFWSALGLCLAKTLT